MSEIKEIIESIRKLGDKELEAEMSYKLKWLEVAYKEASKRIDEYNANNKSIQTPAYEESALMFKGIQHQLMAIHCEASIAVSKSPLGTPMPSGGERFTHLNNEE